MNYDQNWPFLLKRVVVHPYLTLIKLRIMNHHKFSMFNRKAVEKNKIKNRQGSGRICLYVACYDFMLGFNVSCLALMFFSGGVWGKIWCSSDVST
jgi:hypothetical protein